MIVRFWLTVLVAIVKSWNFWIIWFEGMRLPSVPQASITIAITITGLAMALLFEKKLNHVTYLGYHGKYNKQGFPGCLIVMRKWFNFRDVCDVGWA